MSQSSPRNQSLSATPNRTTNQRIPTIQAWSMQQPSSFPARPFYCQLSPVTNPPSILKFRFTNRQSRPIDCAIVPFELAQFELSSNVILVDVRVKIPFPLPRTRRPIRRSPRPPSSGDDPHPTGSRDDRFLPRTRRPIPPQSTATIVWRRHLHQTGSRDSHLLPRTRRLIPPQSTAPTSCRRSGK
ncbi:Hypothetical protein NTJ_13379 [Nesidiocoris tenuis]|uniref:Uncharacterized protein n=2 Tax=Nesidiocoris tenuis TaxID=355587 RepID=A0ABN7BA97_9HEMI|nr:Hypothetical protein NTJ_13378 [Nesidiocoris tenuis]BET00563.1 Hypothetical protein NTJ_13379 [Nesidiocoris tenuis]